MPNHVHGWLFSIVLGMDLFGQHRKILDLWGKSCREVTVSLGVGRYVPIDQDIQNLR